MVNFDPQAMREKCWNLLGDIPPLFTPKTRIIRKQEHDNYTLEHLSFENGVRATVYAYLLIPKPLISPSAAILYHHIHGGKYALGKNMVIQTQANGYADGIALAEAGFIVLAIDAYAFGERQHQGALGNREKGAATELSLFKQFLWEGKTLWGMMLHDDLLALAYLKSRDDVDNQRIGTTGMSLGGSRSTWVAALDGKIKAVIPIAQMTRYADFAASGNFALHSIYYYVPEMLRSGVDMEHIVALAVPAYQHILIGENDPLSPLSGVDTITNYAKNVYRSLDIPQLFEITRYPNLGHSYIPSMVETMIESFKKYL